ncbi:MAG: citrate synthase [Trueperaceae bacterium]|nr:citrate synthase [Trueperaceae bacterium]MCO5174749.1 citrate synthase [Trueperaceae bacterium]MCW5821021.1 citrate synthase [Trueperaceae bacterium]
MEQTINRGLDGVYIDTSAISFIDGGKGQLVYSGYDITELADKASYEEVVYLLWNGNLPNRQQLEDFKAEIAPHYAVPDAVYDLYRNLPHGHSPMHAIRTAASMLGAYDDDPDGVDLPNVRRIGLKLLAQFQTITAAYERIRRGLQPVAPRPDLSLAGNFLYTLTGEVPSEAATRVMDVALVLHAEHGSNASTFVARATASTLTDVYSAITAAIGALKGPLHGGANTAVMQALEGIGDVAGVEPYVLGVLAKPGGRVMGFGHRVYKVLDPRAQVLKEVSRKLALESGDSKWFDMSLEMERVMDREMAKEGKEVKPNVDFFSASVYRMLGFPSDMYTPIFAVARISGWMAHLFEQYADNRLMRPRLAYSGTMGLEFVPIEQR